MAPKKHSILQEAIADARAVRETALANAKIAIEEAFTPHLKSMLSQKIKTEAESPDAAKATSNWDEKGTGPENGDGTGMKSVSEDNDASSEIGSGGVTVSEPAPKQPSKAASDSSNIENKGLEVEKLHEVDTVDFATSDPNKGAEAPADVDKFAEDVGLDSPSEPFQDDRDDDGNQEDDLDLEAIIRELEQEPETDDQDDVAAPTDAPTDTLPAAVPADDIEAKKDDDSVAEDASTDPTQDDEKKNGTSDEDDEINLEEILKEMEDEDGVDSGLPDVTALKQEVVTLRGELKEYAQAVKLLRSRLQETNILNAKLLYTNKLFKSYNMNVGQKMRVIETFDRAQTIRETKLIFATLCESFNDGNKVSKKQRVVESISGSASRTTKSTAPAPEVLAEGTELASRFKKLAGIKSKSR
jgi:hypothetical protein